MDGMDLVAGAALLLGLFVVPLALLALGHRLRERSPRQRGAFWGGVIGHTAAVIAAVVALHAPPVVWAGGVREAVIFGAMLTGGVLGAGLGVARAGSRQFDRSTRARTRTGEPKASSDMV